MKCVQYTGVIDELVGKVKRLHDAEASQLVETGLWRYIPKSEFKKIVAGQKEKANAGPGGPVE